MLERAIVSPSIEKTGGQSLLAFYAELSSPTSVLVYNSQTNNLLRLSQIGHTVNPQADKARQILSQYPIWPYLYKFWSLIRESSYRNSPFTPSNLPDDAKVIHGHFIADTFDGCVTDPFLTIVVRDPFSRMWSQYQYWETHKGIPDWRKPIPYDEQMTFEEYALLEELRNYQTQILAGKELGQFVVGTTESLGLFGQVLVRKLQDQRLLKPSNSGLVMPRINHIPSSEQPDERFRPMFEKIHQEDVELYKHAAKVVEGYI